MSQTSFTIGYVAKICISHRKGWNWNYSAYRNTEDWMVRFQSSLCSILLTLHRRLNTSPSTIEDRDILKLHLVNPPVKKIDLHFPLGLEVTARNMKGVTIKDALDAIYKQFKKKVPMLNLCYVDNRILTCFIHRLMTSWKSLTLLASSGTRKRAGHVSLFTRPSRVHRQSHQARSQRRSLRRERRVAVHLPHNPLQLLRYCLSLLMSLHRSSWFDMLRLSSCFVWALSFQWFEALEAAYQEFRQVFISAIWPLLSLISALVHWFPRGSACL